MMMKTNPLTPPPELVRQWDDEWFDGREATPDGELDYIATQAAQWGADQELESCCEWLECNYNYPQVNHPLRAARRPKPPSDKELALEALQFVDEKLKGHLPLHNHCNAIHTIRRAIEQLPD
jgi:hypothetical protein